MTAAARTIAPADVPAAWRDRIGRMDPTRAPCPGFFAAYWPAVHAAMLDFLEEWGPEAVTAGWRTIDLFGVHRDAGAIRADSSGALIDVYPPRVVAVAPGLITFASDLKYRGMTNPGDSIPIWTFGRSKA